MALLERLGLKKRAYVPPYNQPQVYVDAAGRLLHSPLSVYAGQIVDETTVLSVPGLWRGITLISNTIGALPIAAYRGNQKLASSPLLERPNPQETRIETISAMVASLIVHGNYVAILGQPGPNGYPEAFYPVAAPRVNVIRRDGRNVYRIDEREYDPSEILHVKNFGLPGSIVGLGILAAQRHGIGSALAMQEYAARYFTGGAQPTGIIYSENADLTQDEADMIKAAWMRHYGGTSREPAVLNATTKFQQLSDNAKDSQLVESRAFSLSEQANILGISGYLVGAPNSSRTYSNIESEAIEFVKQITPLLVRIESALTDLIPRGQYAKFTLDALLRGDTLSRYQAHAIALSSGFLTVDEVRELENRETLGEVPPSEDEVVTVPDQPELSSEA